MFPKDEYHRPAQPCQTITRPRLINDHESVTTFTMSSAGGPPKATYGFIGIGTMGYGMAMNLRSKIDPSCRFLLCEINEQRRDQFVKEAKGKVEVVYTPKEMAEQADILITMLPKAVHVKAVFTDPKTGFLSIDKPKTPKFFLDCTTIDCKSSLEMAKAVKDFGVGDFIDAPVSGGPPGADAGTLTFMCGGTQAIFDRAVPILETMGKKESIILCGEQSAGLAVKQLNNYLAYAGYVALCEVMSTGVKYGLDPKILADVLNKSSGMNWNSLNMNPVKGVQPNSSASRDFKGGFTTELAHGVIEMAANLMGEMGTRKVIADTVKGLYDEALEDPRTKGQEARSVYRFFDGTPKPEK